MSVTDPAAGGEPVKPYGWIGLPISVVAILALGVALCAVVVGSVFVGEAVILGWREAASRVTSLRNAARGDPSRAEFILLCLSLLIYVTTAAAVFTLARVRGGRLWRDLIGWHRWSRHRLKLFCAVVVLTLLYGLVANALLAHFYPTSQDWVKLPHGGGSVVLFFAVAVLAAPLTEELIFRGWIYTALRARLGMPASLVIASALFALAHWERTHLYALVVFPIGLALGYIRERTDTLKASIAVHALFNGMAFVMLLANL